MRPAAIPSRVSFPRCSWGFGAGAGGAVLVGTRGEERPDELSPRHTDWPPVPPRSRSRSTWQVPPLCSPKESGALLLSYTSLPMNLLGTGSERVIQKGAGRWSTPEDH